MFGQPKKVKFSKNEQKILDAIRALSQNPALTADERATFERAQALMEAGQYVPAVLKRLENTLRPQAVSHALSPEASRFYSGISRQLTSVLPLGSNPNAFNADGGTL